MIIDHNHAEYKQKWNLCGSARYNGAYFYSQEIARNIIPNVQTDRSWITVNVKGVGCDHAIVFVHNNLHPENYEWLSKYDDLIFVCGIPETMDKVKHLGKVIYLPLSVDVDEVKAYATEKKKGTCFAGRRAKRRKANIPNAVATLEGIPRQQMLKKLAEYEKAYAVGRTAIEAKILGCEILPYDERFPDTERWQILDNKDAAKILQEELDKIDEEKPEAPAEEGKSDWSLSHMNKTALKEYAEERGLELSMDMKKAEMIERIKEARDG